MCYNFQSTLSHSKKMIRLTPHVHLVLQISLIHHVVSVQRSYVYGGQVKNWFSILYSSLERVLSDSNEHANLYGLACNINSIQSS